MSRPFYKPSENERKGVAVMAASGMRHEDICQVIRNPESSKPLAYKTFIRVFANELANGRKLVVSLLERELVGLALYAKSDRVRLSAMEFYLQTKGGFNKTLIQENTGLNGLPFTQVIQHQFATADDITSAVKEAIDSV